MWLAVSEHLNNVEGNTGVWRLSERYATIHYGSGRLDLHSCLKGVAFAPKRRAPLHAAAAAPMKTRCGISADCRRRRSRRRWCLMALVNESHGRMLIARSCFLEHEGHELRAHGSIPAAAPLRQVGRTAIALQPHPSPATPGRRRGAWHGRKCPPEAKRGHSGCHKGRQGGRTESDPSEQNNTMRSHGTFLHLILSSFAIGAAPPKTVP